MDSIKQVDTFITNTASAIPAIRIIIGLILTFVIFFSGALAIKLPSSVIAKFQSSWVKAFALTVTLAVTTKQPTLSIAVVAGLFAAMNSDRYKTFWESFKREPYDGYDEYEDYAPYSEDGKVILDTAKTDDIFKAKRNYELDDEVETPESVLAATISSYGVTIN